VNFSLDLANHPGRQFLAAAMLPLLPAIVLAITQALRLRLGKLPALLAIAAMLGAAACSIIGSWKLFHEPAATTWTENVDWIRIGAWKPDRPADTLALGYRVDALTALMTSMVTVVGSLIFVFAMGYMKEAPLSLGGRGVGGEEDHPTHSPSPPTPLPQGERGVNPFARFYLFLSLFAASMLNLLIADNLFQVFACWELVGVCSFFLIGFYTERRSAGTAANKAFIMNRIGDAGFLIALGIAFTHFRTFNIAELNAAFPGAMSQEMGILMGLGLFLGCAGKSAQIPLQTWLPDAMEGPTPVSALIHAATMVAAGVYLVGRCYPLFAPEVLLVIAYSGMLTAFISATIALVQTDIKRVLAYSTCSQLGFMMLALGVGGWVAGLMHLLTHAFFKALLFLCAGSVIHGCHHEQDLRKMGGLRKTMPITAFTMLIGVLAISGMPLFSGWYSKDRILADALTFGMDHREHALLFLVPLVVAGMTAFYMFRLWFLAFAGTPREHPNPQPPPRSGEGEQDPINPPRSGEGEQDPINPPRFGEGGSRSEPGGVHESPWVMTLPLIVLALFSLGIAWGWPVWEGDASVLGHALEKVAPPVYRFPMEAEHWIAEGGAFAVAIVGFILAYRKYGRGAPTSEQLAEPKGLLAEKWYFDRLYDATFRRGTVKAAYASANLDKSDNHRSLDGTLNTLATGSAWIGSRLRKVQTGRIRQYVFALALTVLGLLGMLSWFTR
jgi:NADH-quinone oxidoreductase subunit L